MAANNNEMTYPILFDLEAGVKKAAEDWDNKYADKLEKAIQKRALEIKLRFDTTKLDTLDQVKQRLAQLKIEPITPDSRDAIRDLVKELNALAKAMEKVQKFSKTNQLGQQNFRNDVALERLRQANERLEIQKRRVALAEQKHAEAVDRTSRSFRNQDGYVSRLIKRLAVYAGFSQIMNFLTQIREVTAQFELQRVSLGAIIQDQARANQLFSEIKQFALKSPVSILDLTKYTKQVAAYRIETDKLFDTTKRLADVSVGLGVDMGRIVLAYGQVKAASYLRAAEIRQFTEAGIPMLELLAEKFTKLNGEMVTTDQVMDMVSKRGVQFSMVEEIFNDMTSAGGMFYNMQEKQGNTLYGMWAKLGDAASLMYEQIGNTESVNKSMKEGIQILTTLMREWKSIAKTVGLLGGTLIVTVGAFKTWTAITQYQTLATKKNTLAHIANRVELIKKNAILRMSYALMRQFGMSMNRASALTMAFSKALKVAAAVSFGAITLGIGILIEKMFQAYENAHRLGNALKGIKEETAVEQDKSVRNFEYLANVATDATKGYKERKEALDELQRTYKNILPQEVLELDYLTKLKGNYVSLTNSIKLYVAERQRQKELDTIAEEFTAKKLKYQREQNKLFEAEGWSSEEIGRFWAQFEKGIKKDKSLELAVKDAIVAGGHDASEYLKKLLPNLYQVGAEVVNARKKHNTSGWWGDFWMRDDLIDNLDLFRDAIIEENNLIAQNEAEKRAAATATSKFAEAQTKLAEKLANMRLAKGYGDKGEIGRDSYLGGQVLKNENIKGLAKSVDDYFTEIKVKYNGNWTSLIQNIDAKKPELISSLDFSKIIADLIKKLDDPSLTDDARERIMKALDFVRDAQQAYMKLAPSNVVVQTVNNRLNQIVRAAKATMDDYVQYQMKSGQSLEDFRKDLKGNIDGLKNEVKEYLYALKQVLAGEAIYAGQIGYGLTKEQIEAKVKQLQDATANLEKLYGELPNFDKSKGSSGSHKSDDRLSKLQEILSTLEKINSKYEELRKNEGDTKALEDVQKMYANTLAYANKLGKQFGLSFKTPTDFKNLQEYRKAILGVINTLKMKGYEKAALDLEEKIGTGDIDKLQKKIEKQLKELADRISRTKTAKEFYEKILSQTGDVELAANLAVSVYGQNGGSLKQEIASQLTNALKGVTANGQAIGNDVWVDGVIDPTTAYVNYKKLRELLDKVGDTLPEKQKQILEDMLKNGEAYNKAQVEQWAKDLAKIKDYTDQYIDLYRMTEQRKAEIRQKMASGELGEASGNKEIAGYDARLAKESAKIQYEAFKNSPMYTSLFENMENATVQSLQNMRKQIEKMMSATKEPTQLKELQNRLNEIDDTLAEKSPFEVIAKGWQTMGEMAKKYGSRSNLDNLIKKKQAELDTLQGELDAALAKEAESKRFAEMVGVDVQNPATAITPVQKAALAAYQQASANVKKYGNAVKKADEEQQELTSDATQWANAMGKVKKGLKTVVQIGQKLLDASEAAAEFAEALGMSEDGIELFQDINNVISNTLSFADSLIGCVDLLATTTAESISTVEKASVILTAISMALKLATAITSLFVGSKVRKANKEIERQQGLLDNLEYAYKRLEKAAEGAFGADYMQNLRQQQSILEAQRRAYQRQAEAERSKGKKADKNKIKEYEDAARDAADAIADMQMAFSEQMLGSKAADAARDFAQAWLDAYKEFGSTTDAMGKKFKDMVQTMVVNSVLGKVMERALKPVYDMVEGMNEGDFYDLRFWERLAARTEQAAQDADRGARAMSGMWEKAGIDFRESGEVYTGIAREIAGASEESINGLAAAINTQNWYISRVPAIAENVAAIRMLMEGGNVSVSKQSGVDVEAMMQQSLENQAMIVRNTAETVAECRNIAAKCQEQTDLIRKVIVPKNQSGGAYKVYVGL